MKPSVARRVSLTAVIGLACSLVAVGVTTGTLHHLRELRTLDQALLSAADARAHSDRPLRAIAGHPEIETWNAGPGDDRVPPRIFTRVSKGSEPLIKDMGPKRIALVPFEADGAAAVAAAWAPKVTLARSVGALAGIWLLSSSAILAGAGLVIRMAVQRAFAPIDRARADVAHVVAIGEGQRVVTDAPVEVAALLSSVNDLLDRLERAHGLQVRFVADAAHELRTPVTSLLGQLEVALRRERSAEESRAVLESAKERVDHLRRLVEALTALARVDAGEVEAHKELVRAADLAQVVLEAERPSLGSVNVTLHADDDPEIRVHRVLLELALQNLLRNAAKHAPGSEVTFTVRQEGERVVFEVRDTGPGISAELAESVFERFTRGPAAHASHPPGLGLGLPLAREVARHHGGDCVLKPIPGGGTRALLDVPCAAPSA